MLKNDKRAFDWVIFLDFWIDKSKILHSTFRGLERFCISNHQYAHDMERNEVTEFHFIFFLISFLSSIAYLYFTRVLFPVIIISIIMSGRSLRRWRPYLLLRHFEVEIWRGIHSGGTYLGHIDLTGPIALQAKQLSMFFKVKPRLDNEHEGVDSIGGKTIALNADLSFEKPLLFPAIPSRPDFFFFIFSYFRYFFFLSTFVIPIVYCFEIKFTRQFDRHL